MEMKNYVFVRTSFNIISIYKVSSKNNEDDFGKEKVTHAKRIISERERLEEELKKKPVVKERGIFRKAVVKLKSRGELYQKEIELMKKGKYINITN